MEQGALLLTLGRKAKTMSTDADAWGVAARLSATEDGREGVLSFIERREARFTGRWAPHVKEERR
jgi:hypothetical protein